MSWGLRGNSKHLQVWVNNMNMRKSLLFIYCQKLLGTQGCVYSQFVNKGQIPDKQFCYYKKFKKHMGLDIV